MLALLDAGASIDAADVQGLTALAHAALNGQEDCVCTLLIAGPALPTSWPADEEEEAAEAQALIRDTAQWLGLLPAVAAAGESTADATTAPASPGGPAQAQGAGAALDDALRSDVCCPITHEVMEDPVIAADGTTYQRQAIAGEAVVRAGWRGAGGRVCLVAMLVLA